MAMRPTKNVKPVTSPGWREAIKKVLFGTINGVLKVDYLKTTHFTKSLHSTTFNRQISAWRVKTGLLCKTICFLLGVFEKEPA
jgi:hypothetical protein